MLSRKFYTIFSLLLVVLFIGSIWYNYSVMGDVFEDARESIRSGNPDSIADAISKDSRVKISAYFELGVRILAGIYWIFILVLALKLHALKKISLLETIVIIIFAPLAVIFYLISLRGKLKQVEREGRANPSVSSDAPVQPVNSQ